MWGRVTGNPFFEHRLPIVSVETSIATFPKPSPSGVEYFDRGSVDHPIQGRRASDIPHTRHQTYPQAKRMRPSSTDSSRPVSGE